MGRRKLLLSPLGIAAILSGGRPKSTILNGLVAYWKFEEATANPGVRYDATGRGNDVTPVDYNKVATVTGKQGNALRNIDTNIGRPSTADLSMGDIDFEIFGWVQIKADPAGTAGGIFDKFSTDPDYQLYYTKADGLIHWRKDKLGGGEQVEITASTFGAVPLNTWLFFDVYHDSVNNLIGISINRGAWDTLATSTGVRAGTSAWMFGAKYPYTSNTILPQYFDELGIMKNRLLTDVERDALYNGGSGITYPFDGSAYFQVGDFIYTSSVEA